MLHLGHFRQPQAQVVVFDIVKRAINAADLLEHVAPQQTKVKGHEVEQQTLFGVRNAAAMSIVDATAVFVNGEVIGVD